jgi:outer membrane protein OmpA-like peptidoglycan-associated protein
MRAPPFLPSLRAAGRWLAALLPALAGAIAGAAAQPAPGLHPPCPRDALAFIGRAEPLTCLCADGGARSVWGSHPYTADSDICRAARHAGLITERGGPVTLRMGGAEPRFEGSRRNGVTTTEYGPFRASFRFEGVGEAPPPTAAAAAPAAPPPVPACPDNLLAHAPDAPPLRCRCTPEATQRAATIWGTDAYTSDSALCRAALHAGVVRRAGGEVVVRVLPGLPRYVGSTQNGVASQNFGPWRASFRFELPEAPGPRLCPDNMTAFSGTEERLECVCTGEAVLRNATVWGSGPYTADSATCRAARHAGVAPVTGGVVTVRMTPGANRWAASTRHGVETRAWTQPYPSGFRFEGPQNTEPGPPVQPPIADSLRRQGRVTLYATFRTGSAELDPPALALLAQLRAALEAEPGMRLSLTGHTDSQGGPAINDPLSRRRAEAVRDWLTANGIAAERLSAAGRGANEPIADNETPAGRALNRRVEAERTD